MGSLISHVVFRVEGHDDPKITSPCAKRLLTEIIAANTRPEIIRREVEQVEIVMYRSDVVGSV
jgi:hypothetical protein